MKDVEERPLDDLLSQRGKPFADWKEERKYLRDKWGMQGRQSHPGGNAGRKESRELIRRRKKNHDLAGCW